MVTGISAILNGCLEPMPSTGQNGSAVINAPAALAPDDVANKSIVFTSSSRWRDENDSYERPVVLAEGFAQYWNPKSQRVAWTSVNEVFSPSASWSERPLVWKQGNTVSVTESRGTGDDYMENRYNMVYKRTGPNTAFVEYNHYHDRMNRSYHHCNYYELTFETPTSGTYKAICRECIYFGYEDLEKGNFILK